MSNSKKCRVCPRKRTQDSSSCCTSRRPAPERGQSSLLLQPYSRSGNRLHQHSQRLEPRANLLRYSDSYAANFCTLLTEGFKWKHTPNQGSENLCSQRAAHRRPTTLQRTARCSRSQPVQPFVKYHRTEHSPKLSLTQRWIRKTCCKKEAVNFVFSPRSKISNLNFLCVKLCSCSLYQLARKMSRWIGAILRKTSIALR